jgi:hypothetical protein
MTDALLSESLVVILASACAVALLTRVGLPVYSRARYIKQYDAELRTLLTDSFQVLPV